MLGKPQGGGLVGPAHICYLISIMICNFSGRAFGALFGQFPDSSITLCAC